MAVSQLFSAGGVTMWPLLICSVLAIALIVERSLFWLRLNRRQKRFLREVIELYRHDPAQISSKLQQYIDLPLARIFLAAVLLEDPNPEEYRLALESEAQAELPLLKRFSTIFDTIVALAPLLGLLGTILGLISSFASLSLGDVGGTQTAGVTAGISEALVSTAAGLIVAIVTLVFSNIFRGLYQRQLGLIQQYGGQMELIYRRRYERAGRGYAST
ncbi:MAG: MotA/TolQ/ExbB proton channel family protein [Thermosynechococcaceae cyanobacterium MS004]|nr:MotA/TolQ/ExbB proton channel family protein [Thermosynechococcaceae cyanobacterium MS004]